MAKQTFQPNPRVHQIFEDLEKYLEFCADYGYKFDEATLYDMRSFPYRQLKNNYQENILKIRGRKMHVHEDSSCHWWI